MESGMRENEKEQERRSGWEGLARESNRPTTRGASRYIGRTCIVAIDLLCSVSFLCLFLSSRCMSMSLSLFFFIFSFFFSFFLTLPTPRLLLSKGR